MYEMFRSEVLRLLGDFSQEELAKVAEAMDITANGYTISKAETALCVPGRQEFIDIATAYIITRKTEGLTDKSIEQMARILKTHVDSGISLYRNTYAVGNTTREESKLNKDRMGENEDLITSICTSSVSGAKAVKTNQYYNENNGEYTVHVCVEMDTEVVLNNLDYDKIEQLISDDQRLEIDFNRDQFKKQLKADIEAYKNKR